MRLKWRCSVLRVEGEDMAVIASALEDSIRRFWGMAMIVTFGECGVLLTGTIYLPILSWMGGNIMGRK
jgi:hypothetical protein